MRYLILILFFIAFTLFGRSQGAYEGPSLIYTNQVSGGAQLSTTGWGVQFNSGKYDGFYKIKTKGFEFVKIKHPKEFKLPNNGRDNSRRFAYGKLNSFQSLRLLRGAKQIVSDKIRHGAVAIGYKWGVGPNVGFVKPIYVEVSKLTGTSVAVERYDPEIHDFNVINGRANFLRGLDEMKLAFGAVAKIAATFEYSGDNEGVQQLEVGVVLDAFLNKVPIMIEEANNQRFFPSIFISYSVGKKYVKR
ncbi:MAG: hypothetical protein ACI9O4_002558 [Chitinophagales bacterium]|jgi:hypothetical protein|tara:strand:+ start:273 stop:1010 length:738 start_codon:yes stop_codon:yes gene_type:complete